MEQTENLGGHVSPVPPGSYAYVLAAANTTSGSRDVLCPIH